MSEETKSCRTCIYADWERTPSGRIKQDTSARCLCPDPIFPPLPICISRYYSFRKEFPRRYVSQDETGCPCHKEDAK